MPDNNHEFAVEDVASLPLDEPDEPEGDDQSTFGMKTFKDDEELPRGKNR